MISSPSPWDFGDFDMERLVAALCAFPIPLAFAAVMAEVLDCHLIEVIQEPGYVVALVATWAMSTYVFAALLPLAPRT